MSDVRSDRPRLIYNDDGSNFLYAWDDLGADDLRAYLGRLAGTQVDMVVYCVAFGGYVCYYDSDVAEPLGSGFGFSDRVKQRRWNHNRARLRREAGDYITCVFATLADMGIPALASIRMNDAHMSSDPTGPVAGRFWMNHPEWRLGEPYGYYGSCLDYSVPAVRAYLRRLAQEVIEKFPDIAGLELDAMRSPFFFKPDEGRDNAPLITELIRQVRGDLDQAALAAGRDRYLLHVNVPRRPDLALESGLDVVAWDTGGLVDSISVGCYNTDFQVPIGLWKAELSDRVGIYPYLNCSPSMAEYMSLEHYRAAADNAYAAGAHGIYLFNFPCFDELSALLPRPIDQPPIPVPHFHAQGWHPDLEHTRKALGELGDPATIAAADRHYLFYWASTPHHHYTPQPPCIDRLAPETAELIFRCHHLADAAHVELRVKAIGVSIRDDFAFRLNGKAIAPDSIQRLHAPGGRDTRIHGTRLDPYSQYIIQLPPDLLAEGDNLLTVALTAREPDLFGTVTVGELELIVTHG